MADLNDLKDFADDITPTIRDLVNQWIGNQQPVDAAAAAAAIAMLQKLLAKADEATPRDPDECSAVLAAQHEALTQILIQAATHPEISIPPTKAAIIREQLLAIKSATAELAVVQALTPLDKLLSPDDLKTFSGELQAARDGIQQKQTAQKVLNTVIDVVILASKIAVKVAAL